VEKTIEIIDMRITDKWGVEWNEMETTRDFLQNFYDANSVKDIAIECSSTKVTVSAPAVFDYKELIYMGSDKGQDSNAIGQYGEGFKASLLNAMRNWNCNVELSTGNKKLKFFFKSGNIGKSEKKIIFCELLEITPINGTELTLSNCPSKLIEEFKFGMKYFYYDGNQLFGDILLDNYSNDISVLKSTEKYGYIFYKRLLRAKIDLPIIIVCNKEYKIVDKQIKHDRDRKAFNEKVIESLLKYVFKQFYRNAFKKMIVFLKNWWEKGDKYLAVIAETQGSRWYHQNSKADYFPEEYYAKESFGLVPPNGIDKLLLEIKTKEIAEKYKKEKYICCPRYMSYFGMKTPDGEAIGELTIQEEEEGKKRRSPTILELESISVLIAFCKEISADLYKRYENAVYTIGTSDNIIGQNRSKNYKEKEIFLNVKFFMYPFADAAAILLHELNHIYGYDGSRFFSDALTEIISIILQNKIVLTKLAEYDKKWNGLQELIKIERDERSNEIDYNELKDRLTHDQLRNIINEIPEHEFKKMILKFGYGK